MEIPINIFGKFNVRIIIYFQICLKRNCVRMDWVCLNWNTSSIEYYKRKGAIDLTANEKWHLFRMKGKEIEAFAKENCL